MSRPTLLGVASPLGVVASLHVVSQEKATDKSEVPPMRPTASVKVLTRPESTKSRGTCVRLAKMSTR
jgi:hypothetical protein